MSRALDVLAVAGGVAYLVVLAAAAVVTWALALSHYGNRAEKADRVHRRNNPDGGAR